MRSVSLVWVAALALAWAAPAPLRGGEAAGKQKEGSAELTPAEAARKALDQKVTIDYLGQSLQEVVQHLREKTKVNFVLESGYNFAMPGGGFPGGRPGVGPG